jgi:FMN-dependent NADH-azoreductase
MSKILLVTSSPRGDISLSSKVARTLADGLAASDPGSTVTVRDLVASPLPHIGPDFTGSAFTAPEARSPDQVEALALSNRVIDELLAADVVIIAAGLINFGTPSTLKAWIDHVTRVGRTFAYGEGGPKGLVTGKKVYLVEAYGGIYSIEPNKAANHLDPHLRTALAFVGLTDIETIVVEGVALGQDSADKALAAALKRVPELVAAA